MTDQEQSTHRRSLKRHSIESAVEVYDSLRGMYLGRLVNIHSDGLMLMGENAVIAADRLYQLDLHLPQHVNGKGIMHLGVDCLWVRESDECTKHLSGFQIIDMAPETKKDIEELVLLLGEEKN